MVHARRQAVCCGCDLRSLSEPSAYVSYKGYPRFRWAVAAAPQFCSLSATSCYGCRVPALLVLWDIDHTLIDSGRAGVHV